MKRLVVIAALTAASSPIAHAQSLADLMKTYTAAWNAPFEPFTIMGNVHYVGTNGIASYLITTSAGHILVDTGLPEANAQIKDSIGKLGFKVSDIKILLNTHAHLDHTGGLADFKQVTGAQLIAGERDKPLLEGGYYPGQETVKILGFPPVKVDRTVKDGDTVTLGDVTLTAHATPGHPPH
jgi:metallo-beta-lactamase class B